MASRRPVPVTRRAAGEPAATSDDPGLVVEHARCRARRLQASGRAEAPGPAPVAEAGTR